MTATLTHPDRSTFLSYTGQATPARPGLNRMFSQGSYGCGTAIRPALDFDLDMGVCFPPASGSISIILPRLMPGQGGSVHPWLYAIVLSGLKGAGWALAAPMMDVPAVLASVRTDFSLNMAELARALKVSRPTIYSWSEGSAAKPENRLRLNWLKSIGTKWKKLSPHPLGALVREAAGDGLSIVDLLSREDPDEPGIMARLNECADALAMQAASRGPSMRDLLAKHGIKSKPVPEDDFRGTVEWYSALGR